jgi:hypothetical protein
MRNTLTATEAAGMTVNERLYLAGLLDDFDKALKQKDKLRLKSILERVSFSSEMAQEIVDQLVK